MSLALPERRVQRVRHELVRREVAVVRVEPLGDRFVSIVFGGPSLAGFASDGFDDHVKFMFADASGELVKRDYTPRRFDPGRLELTIEFALHGHGAASEWARHAAPDAPAVIGGPKNSMVIPVDYDWHLLAGDSTALPAIDRRLEELPAETQAFVRVQVADASEIRPFHSAARLDVKWLTPTDDLAAEIDALDLPPPEGFAWAAGEASLMARLRQVLLVDKGHPREAARVSAYWKQGEGSFHKTLD